jgi:hypothetical protein
MKRGNSPA